MRCRQTQIINTGIAVVSIFFLSLTVAIYVYLISCASGNWAERPYAAETVFSRLMSRIANNLPLRYDIYYGLPTASVREYFLFIVSFCLLFLSGIWFVFRRSIELKRLYQVRWILAAVLVVAVVAMDLNSTSLYCWKNSLGLSGDDAPIWGVPRWIRWDEYHIWTPMALSQALAGYPSLNPYMMGGGVDVTWVSMGGLPARNAALVFKPLYWGFLVLGASRGISFLGIMRSVLLFGISFECAMCYTGRQKWLSFLAGMLFTFSPYIQWWYSQSVAEVFIFGQLILLCIYGYVHTEQYKKRLVFSLLSAYCTGCLIMVGYPSWVVPVLYLAIVVIAEMLFIWRDHLNKIDLLRLLLPQLAALTWIAVIVWLSKDTLLAVRNSSYPGARLYTGGTFSRNFASLTYTLLMPIMDPSRGDPSSVSCFLSFFPSGMLLSFYTAWKEKKFDRLSLALIICELLVFAFQFLGVSKTIARWTLLSQCTHMEALLGAVDIVLLLRMLSIGGFFPFALGFAMALVCTTGAAAVVEYAFHPSLLISFMLACGNFFVYLMLLTCRPDRRTSRYFLTYSVTSIMILAGCFVNPIQKGTAFITESNMVQQLRTVGDEDSLCLMEGDGSIGDLLILAGKRAFNSMQVYAAPEKWSMVDPDGDYYDIYNQLCNISSLALTNEPTSFESLGKASIKIQLHFDDLKKFDVDYVISQTDYRETKNSEYFELLDTINEWYVYAVV